MGSSSSQLVVTMLNMKTDCFALFMCGHARTCVTCTCEILRSFKVSVYICYFVLNVRVTIYQVYNFTKHILTLSLKNLHLIFSDHAHFNCTTRQVCHQLSWMSIESIKFFPKIPLWNRSFFRGGGGEASSVMVFSNMLATYKRSNLLWVRGGASEKKVPSYSKKKCLHGATQTVYGANSISMTTLFGQTKLYTGNGVGFDTVKSENWQPQNYMNYFWKIEL